MTLRVTHYRLMRAKIFKFCPTKPQLMNGRLKSRKFQLAIIITLIALMLMVPLLQVIVSPITEVQSPSSTSVEKGIINAAAQANYVPGLNYNPSAAVSYALLVDSKYYHAHQYPAGLNESIKQKNLDYYNSQDCAHFVSEALIAGGLTALANNPPGDNLQGFDHNYFIGSYGIVGSYRLVDFLAGYDLPVFTNKTAQGIVEYNPTPASFAGSPHASIYYVTTGQMMPSYFLSPGDVITDGGAGDGHSMIYIGNNHVLQTDPAGNVSYFPGINYDISFPPYMELNNQSVVSIYIHIPTISTTKTVGITVLNGPHPLNATLDYMQSPEPLKLVSSFPDGVGFGNYSFSWYDNGNLVSRSQVANFTPLSGINDLQVKATGSNGTASSTYTLYVGSSTHSAYLKQIENSGFFTGTTIAVIGIVAAAIVGVVAATIVIRRR